ncbi:MAG: winged helix-turn-helix domain-containing protein [Novosphingobium sp.]|uniref:winged helix-turn-helix domain-containing protein n=1 Tax=Novosphingobium sp. TaxID=1874826 RepID=UPI0032BD7BAF
MRLFRWFSAGPVPAAYDLRQLGWQLLADSRSSGRAAAHVVLGCPRQVPLNQWLGLSGASLVQRKWMMMLEVEESLERARMLRLGFGDALDRQLTLDELELRAMRLAELAQSLPRYRQAGPLRLDLLARDGFVAGRALGLHPREFSLIWRLTETPEEDVSASELLHDVWRLSFRPETNSLAVHISRLRAKLRIAGIDGMVETTELGGYRLAEHSTIGLVRDWGLDGHLRIGEITAAF